MLRPATAPGEDRNREYMRTGYAGELAAPGHRAGRGSQPICQGKYNDGFASLRPATAPGEDRNPRVAQGAELGGQGCARPPRRARIATV